MRGHTHVAFGFLLGTAIATGLQHPVTTGVVVPLVIGSLLPDVDNTNSTLGKIIPLGLVFRHRTVTHSWWMLGAFALNFWLGVGVLSHILLDLLNHAKVQLFYPFPKRIALGMMKMGGLGEWVLFVSILFVIYQGYSLNIGGLMAYYPFPIR